MPYLVLTAEPSTMGSRSLCTPSRETSGPPLPSLPATLSISSIKIIPDCSTLCVASLTTSSISMSFCASSCASISIASGIFTFLLFFLPGSMPPSISFRFISRSSIPMFEITPRGSIFSFISSSTYLSFISPSLSCFLSFSLVDSYPAFDSYWVAACTSNLAGIGNRISSILSSARVLAFS